VKDLYLIKAAQATPFVDTLTRTDAPVEDWSTAAGLPLDAVRRREGVIGERSLWRFIEYAIQSGSHEFLGYRTALKHPITCAAELGGFRMRQAPTLRLLLEQFIEDIGGESTGTHYGLVPEQDSLWFHRRPIFFDSPASWQAEQYVISFVIQIVRLAAGADWLPRQMRICSLAEPGPIPTEWALIQIEWGNDDTEIRIDRSTAELPPRIDCESDGGEIDRADSQAGRWMTIDDLVDRQIWSGELGLDKAAHELGLSPTTMKRHLAAAGSSYSKVLEQRRKRWACQLLAESEVSIQEIARALGYRHKGNFTRAFIRMSGSPPLIYRKTAKRNRDDSSRSDRV
jgi:AraC-like DNA-binding protein